MLPLIIAAAVLAVLAVVLVKLLSKAPADAVPQVVQVAPQPRGVNRMQAGLRRRRAGRRAGGGGEDEVEEDAGAGAGARREGRRGGQEEEEEQEGQPASKRDAYEARRAAREAEREAVEAAQEEEFRRAAEERQRKEEEEAARWMCSFTVEAAGEEAETAAEAEALAERMIEHIKARKVVALDELAAEFGLRGAEAVARVQALEEQGRLTGVMDERGKFIYISKSEMEAARDFIRSRGRIAIAELAHSSELFIDFSSSNAVEA